MKIIFKTIITLLFVSTTALSQVNCDKNLNDARSDYANGNLYAIPGKLTDCLNSGFTKAEKVEAYQLLALTYININQLDKARESLIKLLKIKTDFTVTKNVDPDELYSLYTKIDTDPIYYIGGGIGANFTSPFLPDTVDRFTSESNIIKEDFNYSAAFSFLANVQFIYPITEVLHAKAALSFDVNRYTYSQTSFAFPNSENYTVTDYTATNSGINLLISGRLMSKNKIYKFYKPFFEPGIITRFNANSEINDYNERNNINAQSFVATNIDMNEYRRQFNMGLQLQLGSMIKISENYLEVCLGATYYGIPETKYTDTLHRTTTSVANGNTVFEDLYNKVVFNFTINFNKPFYNFK